MRKRMIRRMRKNLMRMGEILKEEVLNKEEDGSIIADKREWGYHVECKVNGWTISSADDSWYGAYKGAEYCAKWTITLPPFEEWEKTHGGDVIDSV